MSQRVFSVAMFFLLLTSMTVVAFKIQPVNASGTVYIRADGSIDPPTAPISTVDNATYTLTGNITSDADGIVIERNNTIVDAVGYTIQGTGRYPYKGIDLSGRSNVTIKSMEINTFSYGLWLDSSDYNSVIGNIITGNNDRGIFLGGSYNTISGNNVTANSVGIVLSGSSDNRFYHNNFIDNSQQVHVYSGFANVWDDGYPSGGNYWSDYNGTDFHSGPYQNETGSDGIGDVPYVIDGNNIDRFPLVSLSTSLRGDVNYDGVVDIYDAIILAGAFNSIPGSPNWNPNADINKDNTVDIYDAILLAGNFGKSW